MTHLKKKRRLTCLILTALLLFSATGCSSSSASQTSAGTETASTEAEAAVPAETETEDHINEITVTIPGNEDAAEIYQEWLATRETTTAAETEEEATAKDCEYTRTGKPAVALTFDDGPRAGSTDQILDVLEKYNAHATFFIVGENVSQDPDALKREVELGCELGTHTWSHEDLTTLSEKAFNKQINKSVKAIEEASGGKVTVIRPPYGAINSDVKSMLDLPIILWSLDTLDWSTRDAEATLQTVQENVRGGDIILMHDIHQETADAVEPVVSWLIENGYELLTVSELYEYYGEDLTLHKGHGSAG